ncbi:MAG TPA: UDP-glucose/GDP-mannose dehydrogenase family protein, partial [Stellaceae bacterium]|nr:UDP-glucose/GDP-mannose dehydrogenase family protein [Stellaceae bacterium]HTH96455.1 UDP-glucose/GDP-mannose dehydrogenase family protein [Stellaceae bacterium]
LLKDVTYAADAYDAMEGADCLLIITEWNEFRQLDWHYAAKKLKHRAVVDLRNIYKPQQMAELGFTYSSIGRPPVEPKQD